MSEEQEIIKQKLEDLDNERNQALELMVASAIMGNRESQKEYMKIYHIKSDEYYKLFQQEQSLFNKLEHKY